MEPDKEGLKQKRDGSWVKLSYRRHAQKKLCLTKVYTGSKGGKFTEEKSMKTY